MIKMIAHRGDTTTALENTMEAFENAVNAGADGFEFDVRLTADGVPLVYHDIMLNTDTENGFVEDYTYEQIKQLRTTVDSVVYKIPSLDEVLDTFCGKAYLEMHVQDYKHASIHAIGKCLAPYRKDWETCEVTSFDTAMLKSFREVYDKIPCDLLIYRGRWMTDEIMIRLAIEKAKLVNADGVHLPYQYVIPETVNRFRDEGLRIHSGVIKDPSKLPYVQSTEIEIFSTDNIHLFTDSLR